MSFFLNSSQLYNIWDFKHAGHFNFESVFSPEGDFEFPFDSSPVVARLFRLGGRLRFMLVFCFSGLFFFSIFSTSGEKTGSVARSVSALTNVALHRVLFSCFLVLAIFKVKPPTGGVSFLFRQRELMIIGERLMEIFFQTDKTKGDCSFIFLLLIERMSTPFHTRIRW